MIIRSINKIIHFLGRTNYKIDSNITFFNISIIIFEKPKLEHKKLRKMIPKSFFMVQDYQILKHESKVLIYSERYFARNLFGIIP